MENDVIPPILSRRNVLKSASASGAYLTLGSLATGKTAAKTNNGTEQLGEFSDGLDRWKTTGGNNLSRVSEDEMPAAVRVGTHALAVEVDGDLHPAIENKNRVKQADFVGNPFLQAHVLGYAEKTDSDLVFTFRLHHTATPTDGKGKGGGGGKDVLVVESDEQSVAQLHPQHLRWDLSDFDQAILETAKRLEIVWYLKDHPPEDGHRGRSNGDFDYQGLVTFDDIRLTDDVAEQQASASREKKLALYREHGMIVERTFEERTGSLEHGTLVFVDGTEVPYSFEVLADGRLEYTIDGETFLLGGDGNE